jgi:thioredoxin-dependent peroxiredoxin
MIAVTHRGNTIELAGKLPQVGTKAPNFRLTQTDLTDISLETFTGKNLVLNIFPSIDTGTCAASVRRFNQLASALPNIVVICVSKDLPFAHKRFCGAEGIEDVICASQYKDQSFSEGYGVDILDGSKLIGLMSRAVVVIDTNGVVIHTEQVSDISSEPDYEAAIHLLTAN